jgi:hypothetical protein
MSLANILQSLSRLVVHLLAVKLALTCVIAHPPAEAATPSDVFVPGPGTRPEIFFACCDQGAQSLNVLLADRQLFSDLRDLHAGVAVAFDDLNPERARFVQRLSDSGIPAIAWLVLPREQGYYVNAANAAQTAARFAEFDVWTRQNNLRWQAIGLDIEPIFAEFNASGWHIFRMLLLRYFDYARVRHSREAYTALIQQMHARGYTVQTYQMNFLADERRAHSTILQRLFGFVDVHADKEILMVYTSFNHRAGAATVWSYGFDTQAVAVGSTLGSGDPQIEAKFGPLNWDEFSADLLVATHFSPMVGVYSLEGCLRQGFLPRLQAMDWQHGVTLPVAKVAGVHHFRLVFWALLWTASRLIYLLLALVVLAVVLILWRRRRVHLRSGA